MAKNRKANGADDGPTKDHNLSAMKKLILKCSKETVQIKRERQGLNERMADIRKRLKDSGVQTEAFEFAVRLLERDVEARAEYIDQLSINFEALGIGGQGSLLIEEEAPPENAQPIDANSDYYKAGKGVALAGGARKDHDYKAGSDEAKTWQAGWDAGKAERAQANP